MGDEATLLLSFEEILGGEAGPKEAAAAQRWLDAGAPVQPLPSGLVGLDPDGFDMRVMGAQAGGRRRTAAALPDSPAADRTALAIDAKLAGARSMQQQTPAQRPQQVQQPQTQQPAAAPGSTRLQSQTALNGSSNVASLAPWRKGSGPVEFVLPAGWMQLQPGSAGSPATGPTGGKAAKASKAAVSGKKKQAKAAQQPQHQPEQQAAFMSPEGLAFSSLPDVQAVVEGPVIVPRKLVRWLRQAAANPLAPAALDAPNTTIGRAHLLAMRRARVATVAADRQQWERRLEAVAAQQATAERRLRRRSEG